MEGESGRYFYVQMATGYRQWEVPTKPAPSVPSPSPTPQQASSPFTKFDSKTSISGSPDGSVQEADRGLLSVCRMERDTGNANADSQSCSSQNLAMNAITGGKVKPQNQSGLGGLANSFLSGSSSHGGGSSNSAGGGTGGIGGPIGSLVGSLFADKPNNQQQQSQAHQQPSSQGGTSSTGGHQGGGLMGFLGGNHGASTVRTANMMPYLSQLMHFTQPEQQLWLLVHRSSIECRLLRATATGILQTASAARFESIRLSLRRTARCYTSSISWFKPYWIFGRNIRT